MNEYVTISVTRFLELVNASERLNVLREYIETRDGDYLNDDFISRIVTGEPLHAAEKEKF